MSLRLKHYLILAGVAVISTMALWLVAGSKVIYQNYDGPYYAVVAKCWYDKACIGKNFSFPLPLEYYTAHFPIYPAVMGLIGQIGQMGLIKAGVIINLLATIVAAIVMYRLAGDKLWVALAWLFLWPRMWVVRSVGSPETLFILFTLLSLFYWQKKNYLVSGIAGALAVLTKSPGILVFFAYLLNWNKKSWPLLLIPAALAGLFYFYKVQTGDILAYFHSGDNIHLQALPFRVFDSSQTWVGTFWLEDVIWIYLIGAIGVIRAFRKSRILGTFGAVFYATILFVSHRDIARYSLPIVPVILVGLSEIFEHKEVRWVLGLLLVPMFFYSLNFLIHNQVLISDWGPFLGR